LLKLEDGSKMDRIQSPEWVSFNKLGRQHNNSFIELDSNERRPIVLEEIYGGTITLQEEIALAHGVVGPKMFQNT
jgi:hypothetical protein